MSFYSYHVPEWGDHEALGYTLVGQFGEYDYSWNIVVVFKREDTGEVFIAQASGCSCNSPSDFISEASLQKVTSVRDAGSFLDSATYGWQDGKRRVDVLKAVRDALKVLA